MYIIFQNNLSAIMLKRYISVFMNYISCLFVRALGCFNSCGFNYIAIVLAGRRGPNDPFLLAATLEY